MPDQRQFICVTCPVGCAINALVENGEVVEVSGQACKLGIAFVQEELSAPKRMLTTTVRVRNGRLPLVPVRSDRALPKELLYGVVGLLRKVVLDAPVSEHQMVIEDVLATGIDIVTSRSVMPAEERGAVRAR